MEPLRDTERKLLAHFRATKDPRITIELFSTPERKALYRLYIDNPAIEAKEIYAKQESFYPIEPQYVDIENIFASKLPLKEPIEQLIKRLSRYELNDLGNAARFIDSHSDDVFYCVEQEKWYCWQGAMWEQNQSLPIHYAKESRYSIRDEADRETDEKKKKRLFAFYTESGNASRLQNAVRIAATSPDIQKRQEELDRYPNLLNCPNGIVDLQTGELLLSDKSKYLTKRTAVPYDADAKCPKWEAMLEKVLKGNTALIKWLQLWLGYCATGSTGERKLVIAYGSQGNNGKSTIFETASKILRDYADTANPESLMQQKDSGVTPRNDIAAWAGKRMLVVGETKSKCSLDEATVKRLTGGSDQLKARFLYKDFFTFTPTHKVVIHTNHKQELSDDKAIWNRVKLIPFEYSFQAHEIIRDFDKVLFEEEAKGILAWMVRGAVEWYSKGLPENDTINAATNEFRVECDTMERFLTECCDVADKAAVTKGGALWEAYKSFCRDNDLEELSNIDFGRRLKARFTHNKSGGSICYHGIKVAEEEKGRVTLPFGDSTLPLQLK